MYIIKKDGMYLMGYRPSGLTEYDKHGNPTPVYTGIWCSNRRDAKVFDNESFAKTFAGMISGEVLKIR